MQLRRGVEVVEVQDGCERSSCDPGAMSLPVDAGRRGAEAEIQMNSPWNDE